MWTRKWSRTRWYSPSRSAAAPQGPTATMATRSRAIITVSEKHNLFSVIIVLLWDVTAWALALFSAWNQRWHDVRAVWEFHSSHRRTCSERCMQTLQETNFVNVLWWLFYDSSNGVYIESQPQTASQNGRILQIDIRGRTSDRAAWEISCKFITPTSACALFVVESIPAEPMFSRQILLWRFSSSLEFLCQALKSSWERSSSRTRNLTRNHLTGARRRSCPSRCPTPTATRPVCLSLRHPALDLQVLKGSCSSRMDCFPLKSAIDCVHKSQCLYYWYSTEQELMLTGQCMMIGRDLKWAGLSNNQPIIDMFMYMTDSVWF